MKTHLVSKDFVVSGKSFELLYDEEKDMLLTHPQPSSLQEYYHSDDYISHTDSSRGLVNRLYQWVKQFAISRKLKLITRLAQPMRTLLDVGAGTGDFVLAAKNSGWEATGVEPMAAARTKAQAKGIDLKRQLGDLKNQSFQVITLWHVLEHLPDLDNQIGVILGQLEKNGSLVLALPNYKSWDAKHYKEYWAAYDLPRHLWHFSKKSIQAIFEKKGYEIVEVHPLWFDAFYICLLSEKYMHGRYRYVQAFINGIRSNFSAMFNKEYSSLIYVLRRAQD